MFTFDKKKNIHTCFYRNFNELSLRKITLTNLDTEVLFHLYCNFLKNKIKNWLNTLLYLIPTKNLSGSF